MVRAVDFDIQASLTRLERRFDGESARRGLELRVLPSRLRLRSDPALLAQMLDHLVDNSLRFTASGRVLVGCRRCGDAVRIEVWDTGPGLPAQHGAALLGLSSGAKGDGEDGIGLVVVERLAKLLHHRIEVDICRGRGTRIGLVVPMGGQARRQPEEAKRPLMVIIEDEEQVLEGLRLLLESWHFDVVAAASEEVAMAELRGKGHRPAAIIADYRLREGRTGAQAVLRIRDLFRSPIPTIIVTGDAMAGRMRDSELPGCVVLQKPVAASYLHRVLAQTLRGMG